MTSAVCVWREKAGVLVEVEGVSALWWGPLTMPPFHRWAVHRARPTSCPSLPAQLYSLPDPSVWCKWWVRVGEGGEGRLSTANVFFRNRLLLVWLPMKTTPAFAVRTNCPVLSGGAEEERCRPSRAMRSYDWNSVTLHPRTRAVTITGRSEQWGQVKGW